MRDQFVLRGEYVGAVMSEAAKLGFRALAQLDTDSNSDVVVMVSNDDGAFSIRSSAREIRMNASPDRIESLAKERVQMRLKEARG